MREHGMWEISIEAKLKISCEESEMEHSLFERAANKAATPALLCMYSNLWMIWTTFEAAQMLGLEQGV